MPLDTPEGPTQSQWTIRAASTSYVGEYTVPFEIKAVPDNPDADGVYEIVQRLIDLLDSSDDFRVTYATRAYGYQQRITPTPTA
jgi:hypothetical protein